MTREEMIRIICEHTGWEPDWDCTVRLADDIAEAVEGYEITWPAFPLTIDFGGKDKP